MDDWGNWTGSLDTESSYQDSWGSPNSQDYSGYTGPTADVLGSAGQYGLTADMMSGFQANPQASYDPAQAGGMTTPNFGGQGQPMQAPGAQAPGLIPGLGGMGGLNSWQGVLGLGGGLAGLAGALSGGGVQGQQTPMMGTAQKAAINQAGTQMQPFIQGTSPLQMQQQQMMQALMQGQIPQGFSDLIARAYDPQYQQAATRATNAGRQAGFFDAPMSSPPGGAIMGPAAAQLQGQQANSLLGLMQSMPGMYNQPISQQINAAGQQGSNLLQGAGLGIGQQRSAPLGPQIGQQLGQGLQGMSQAMGQNQQRRPQMDTGSYYQQ